MQPDTRRTLFRFLIPIIILVLCQVSVCSDRSILVLRGEKTDCLIDFKRSVFITDGKSRPLPEYKDYGNIFIYKDSLYSFYRNILKNLSQNSQKTFQISHLLPEPETPKSIQHLIHSEYLILPTLSGTAVINMDSKTLETIVELKPIVYNQSVQLPEIAVSGKGVYLFQNNVLHYCPLDKNTPEIIFEAAVSENTTILESGLISNRHYCVLWFSEVDRGEIDSFRIRIVAMSTETHKTVLNTTLSGIVKQPLLDENNILTIPYKKTSIFSNLFGKDKQSFYRINLKSNKVNQATFEVTHKRRHLWEIHTDSGGEYIIQCKNGDTFLTDFNKNSIKKLGSKPFPYRFNTFIKGKHTGYFLNENNISYSTVNF